MKAWFHTNDPYITEYMLSYYPDKITEKHIQKIKSEKKMHYLFGPLNMDTFNKFLKTIT
jgi:hypothetical protein